MGRRLLAAGLTVALHLGLGLAFLARTSQEEGPRPPSVSVELCRLVESVPESPRGPAHPPALPVASRPQPAAVPPHPQPGAEVMPKAAEPPPAPAGMVRPPDQGRPKGRVRVKAAGARSSPDTSRPAADRPNGSAAGRGVTTMGPTVTSPPATTPPATGHPASGGNTPAVLARPATHRAEPESQPRYRKTPKPAYPPLARRMGYQGTVELEVLVVADGTVGEARLAGSSGYPQLDGAALAAVRGWRFEPGTREGEKVAQWIKVPVNFSLR